jgi:hypothetical protein
MIFKIFSPKNLAKNFSFLLEILLVYKKNGDNIGFQEKLPVFSPKNHRNL